jgi:putative ABC transport system ATP-binding protein
MRKKRGSNSMSNITVSLQAKKNVLLKASNLTKVYNAGEEEFRAVSSIDLEIYEGDFTVIMGSSGSGKSTLLYLLSGLDSVTYGEVLFKKERIDLFTKKEMDVFRANKVGYVYQSINLVPDLTLFENIALPGYIAGKEKVEVKNKAISLMKLMDIEKERNRIPSQVSGGQQQRAAIARALINGPELLYADEPTGALNLEQGEKVLDILTQMNQQGQSVVMVTHDIQAACRANRLILIKDGLIDGILELPKFNESDVESRQKKIFSFISRKR